MTTNSPNPMKTKGKLLVPPQRLLPNGQPVDRDGSSLQKDYTVLAILQILSIQFFSLHTSFLALVREPPADSSVLAW